MTRLVILSVVPAGVQHVKDKDGTLLIVHVDDVREMGTVKTREAFKDLRVEPSGKVTAANSYLKHNPKHYNQTNRRALTKLCLGQAAQNRLSSCGCKAVLQAPDFTSFFSRVT